MAGNHTTRPLPDFGPIQLADRLGWSRGDVERARAVGLIPPPDVNGHRWSAALVGQLAARAGELLDELGPPPVGANRAAQQLTAATGLGVHRADVEELTERDLLRVVGVYKDWPLYDPRQLDTLANDTAARAMLAELVAERHAWIASSVDRYESARRVGCRPGDLEALAHERGIRPGRFGRYAAADVDQLAGDEDLAEQLRLDRRLGPDQAATHLGIRRTDFDYVVAAGWVEPVGHLDVTAGRRKTVTVPLYRIGDVETVLDIGEVDWDAVRATPPGHTSILQAYTRLPVSRAQIVRAFCADIARRWPVEFHPRWVNATDTWEITWNPHTAGAPTRRQVAAALTTHPAARAHRHEIHLAPATEPDEPGEVQRAPASSLPAPTTAKTTPHERC
jgi:hypothetical protein